MALKTSKTVLQQTLMMGLFYTGIFLVIEGFLFGEVGSLFTAALTFFQSDDILSQVVAGIAFTLVGCAVVGISVLLAYWLNHKDKFDTDEKMTELCRPFILLFTVILSFSLSICVIYLLFQYGII